MSTKIANYLQEHVGGEVVTSKDAREYFSTDGSIFQLEPQVIVYPRSTSDVRKILRFTWQLAERGKIVPVTARGKGTCQAGGALGSGVMLVFPAHMNKLLELDRDSVTLQPGILYSKLQQTLHTHGRFLPPYPSSIDFSSIGGAIGNNAAGEKSIKYGSTRDYVKSLHVVLSNGELIETRRLGKRELNKKKGLTNFEGEIYRQLDGLLTDNWDLVQKTQLGVSKNTAGYPLFDVRHKDGSIDLTPLFVGAQGTLGVVTQAQLKTEPHNPNTTLISAHFDDLQKAGQAVMELNALIPSAMEIVDEHLLNFLDKHNSKQLKGLVEKPFPKIILLVELDDVSQRTQKRKLKKAKKILGERASEFSITHDEHEKEALWKIRHSAAAVIWQTIGKAKALPIIEDGVVPTEKFPEYLERVYALFKKYHLETAVWGHAGNANLHMQPFLDLSKIGDRQKAFKIMDDYYQMIMELGGSTSGEHNDGRLRAPYLKQLFGDEAYELFRKVKHIFDPHGTLNPGVKIDVTKKDIVPLMRREYSMEHLYDHMPRS